MAGDTLDSPYVGLAPFTEREAQFFFGREHDLRFVIANLFAARLTVLYGPSAAGKSSLLRAGVARTLLDKIVRSRRELGRPDLAFVYHAAWEGDVHERLCAAVRSALRDVAPDAVDKLPVGLGFCDLVVRAVEIIQGDFFLILDQFEEYFDYQPATAEPTLFERELAKAIARPHLPVGFVIALRDDELSRLDRLKPLVPTLFANQMRIRRLTAAQARLAITAPLEEYNRLPPEQRMFPGAFSIEPQLVEAVIRDIGPSLIASQDQSGRTTKDSDEIEAAYLQLVMTAIWKREVADGSTTLHHDTLTALHGAEAIVEQHFVAVMDQFSTEDRDLAAGMFVQLVTPSGRKIPHRLGDLADYSKTASVERLKPIVARLVNAKILVSADPDAVIDAARTYTIRHDALGKAIRNWQREHVSRRLRDKANEDQQVLVREARAQAEREREIARHRERAASQFRSTSFALAVLLTVAAILSTYLLTTSNRVNGDLSAQMARTETALTDLKQREAAARAAARTAEDRLATYRAELQRSKDSVRAFEQQIEQLKADTGLNQRVAELERVGRERDEALARVAAIEKQLSALRGDVTDLTRARDQAILEAREKQQPVVVLQVRPDRRKD